MGAMAQTPAEKQAAYRARLKTAEQGRPEAIEAALLQQAARCGELSQLATGSASRDRQADPPAPLVARNDLSKLAQKVRSPG